MNEVIDLDNEKVLDEVAQIEFGEYHKKDPLVEPGKLRTLFVKKLLLFIIGEAITIPIAISTVLSFVPDMISRPGSIEIWLWIVSILLLFTVISLPFVVLMFFIGNIKLIKLLKDVDKIDALLRKPYSALALYHNLVDRKLWDAAFDLTIQPSSKGVAKDKLFSVSYPRYPKSAEELKAAWNTIDESYGQTGFPLVLDLSDENPAALTVTEDDQKAVLLKQWDSVHNNGSQEIKLNFKYPVFLEQRDGLWFVCTPLPIVKEA